MTRAEEERVVPPCDECNGEGRVQCSSCNGGGVGQDGDTCRATDCRKGGPVCPRCHGTGIYTAEESPEEHEWGCPCEDCCDRLAGHYGSDGSMAGGDS